MEEGVLGEGAEDEMVVLEVWRPGDGKEGGLGGRRI